MNRHNPSETNHPMPLVGVSGSVRDFNGFGFHGTHDGYMTSLVEGAGAQPVIVPPLGSCLDFLGLLSRLDGVMLTGGAPNVHPSLYGGPPSRPETAHQPQRDATVQPLIRAAIEAGVPLFCVCLGIQELNVALGGSLHQYLQEVPGRTDHRRNPAGSREDQLAAKQRIALTPGGMLAAIAGGTSVMVNSMHGQGIDRLAPGLEIEATAADGTIEAVRAKDAPAFTLGVQWHPEWQIHEHPFYFGLFDAFGEACRERMAQRTAKAPVG